MHAPAPKKPRVALTLLGCDASGQIGGAEQFFARLADAYARRPEADFEVHFATMADAARVLRRRGLLLAAPQRVHAAPNLPAWKFKAFADSALLCRLLLREGFDLAHVVMPSAFHAPALALLARLPRRPALVLNITDCTVAHHWNDPTLRSDPQRKAYRTTLGLVPFDGLYSWYTLFRDAVGAGTIRPAGQPLVRAARAVFTDLSRFAPAPVKERTIVFAARLVPMKRPELFVRAVALLLRDRPGLAAGWRFTLMGDGPMREALLRLRADAGLGQQELEFAQSDDLAPVFARSRAFVSCQDHENFTSLAMLEAMACANAVIARNVGQTGEYVRPGENGVLAPGHDAPALARALETFLEAPQHHEAWGRESRRLATEVHTEDAFVRDVEAFWTDVLARRTRPDRPIAQD
jgi:glycosyltransferase involved in cell wall biosynthesis